MKRAKRKRSDAATFSTKRLRLPIALREQRRTRNPVPEKLVQQLLRPMKAIGSRP